MRARWSCLKRQPGVRKSFQANISFIINNNCRIIPGEKEDRVRVSCENYYTVKQLCEEAGDPGGRGECRSSGARKPSLR